MWQKLPERQAKSFPYIFSGGQTQLLLLFSLLAAEKSASRERLCIMELIGRYPLKSSHKHVSLKISEPSGHFI